MPTPIRSKEVTLDITDLRNEECPGLAAGTVVTSVARELVSLLREIFGPAILVISGQSRMMYQNLVPKPKGTIFSKRSKPQGTYSSPHDTAASMAEQLEMNIQGDADLFRHGVDRSPPLPFWAGRAAGE